MRIILRSLPAWGVRVEIYDAMASYAFTGSLPAWGVRVEMRNIRDSLKRM